MAARVFPQRWRRLADADRVAAHTACIDIEHRMLAGGGLQRRFEHVDHRARIRCEIGVADRDAQVAASSRRGSA
ncbi:hypothetical protein ACVK00_000960 [Burkholderia sp. PvR073]